jgi:DNA-binding GntR family transcriptional regulator
VADVEAKAVSAYRQIERMIVFGELTPGTLVSEAVIMDKTGLGRTPVREALQFLARNRMVEIYPNRGVLIPAASVEAELKLLELRRVLEVLAVRLASERAVPGERDEMLHMVERVERSGQTLVEYADTIKGTHDLIVAAAHNDHLADAMAPLQGLSRRFWLTHVVDKETEITSASRLHAAMLRAILARDAQQAEKASLGLPGRFFVSHATKWALSQARTFILNFVDDVQHWS